MVDVRERYSYLMLRGIDVTMTKCYIKECYSVPEIGSYYCNKHRADIIKDFRKRLQNTLLIEEKEKLR